MHQVHFFAGATLSLGGEPVTGPAARRHPLALLAVLCAHATPDVGRDKLIDLLWPERDGTSARHLLSEALYVVRKTLGPECIHAHGDVLTLDRSQLWSDVAAVREALAAGDPTAVVEHYRGPFLDGFHLGHSSEFEGWVSERRACFAAHYEESLYALADGAEGWGDHRAAVRWLRLRVAQDPLSSHATHRLMLALARTGDRASAVRTARSHREILAREMELDPAPCVRELEAALSGSDPVDLDAIPQCGTRESGCAPEVSSYVRRGFARGDP